MHNFSLVRFDTANRAVFVKLTDRAKEILAADHATQAGLPRDSRDPDIYQVDEVNGRFRNVWRLVRVFGSHIANMEDVGHLFGSTILHLEPE
ncbi:MAG TPA: hypothetical protein V6D22_19115 [Candidatus Obscuribacterales bacterium]